jgi:hydroxypyruvate isomerase
MCLLKQNKVSSDNIFIQHQVYHCKLTEDTITDITGRMAAKSDKCDIDMPQFQ